MKFLKKIIYVCFSPFKHFYESDFFLLLGNSRFIIPYIRKNKIFCIYKLTNYRDGLRCLYTGYKRGIKFSIISFVIISIIRVINKSITLGEFINNFILSLIGGSTLYFFLGALIVKHSLFKERRRLENVQELYQENGEQMNNTNFNMLTFNHIDINLGSIDLNKKILRKIMQHTKEEEKYAIENMLLFYTNLEQNYQGDIVDTFIFHPSFARLLDNELKLIIFKAKSCQQSQKQPLMS